MDIIQMQRTTIIHVSFISPIDLILILFLYMLLVHMHFNHTISSLHFGYKASGWTKAQQKQQTSITFISKNPKIDVWG